MDLWWKVIPKKLNVEWHNSRENEFVILFKMDLWWKVIPKKLNVEWHNSRENEFVILFKMDLWWKVITWSYKNLCCGQILMVDWNGWHFLLVFICNTQNNLYVLLP